jgi:hypothetical protein
MFALNKGDHLKKLAFLGSALGLALGAFLVTHSSHAADHLDAPATQANHMADINDVYAWMTSDATKVNLVMTVSPADDTTRAFGPTVQYVFHVSSIPAFGMAGTETKVICTFASPTSAQCWVADGTTTKDYVKGDPSSVSGISSKSGQIKLFAGQRSDPFFFNLSGFKTVVAAVEGSVIPADTAGCPLVPPTTAAMLRAALSATPGSAIAPCPAGVKDCFAAFNVKAIVLQIDKSLLNAGAQTVLTVWGSTHATP